MEFPEIVRRCRSDLGDTQREFAERFDGLISQPQVGHWERGLTRQPRGPALARLAEVCGTTPGALLAATGYGGAPASLETDLAALSRAHPALGDLLRAAGELAPDQVRALVAVARAMRRA